MAHLLPGNVLQPPQSLCPNFRCGTTVRRHFENATFTWFESMREMFEYGKDDGGMWLPPDFGHRVELLVPDRLYSKSVHECHQLMKQFVADMKSDSTELDMPLETPYGVVSGVVDHADLLNPSGGQWPHYHVWVNTPMGQYDSAINLKSLSQVKIEYRIRDLNATHVAAILALADGWTPLTQTSTSGAWDYVRHPGLTGTAGWVLQTGNNLINALQYLLTDVTRIHVFGAAYDTGLGVHDVHMNQGDPLNSEFAHLDAIWQDGGVLFEYGGMQPRIVALQIKFETQSLYTDEEGRPAPIKWIPPKVLYMPLWKWPPGDPMSDIERRHLQNEILPGLLRWAGAIYYLDGEAKAVLKRELENRLASGLPGAQGSHIERIADYVVDLSVAATVGQTSD